MKALRGVDFTKHSLSIIILGTVVEIWLSQKPCQFIFFSINMFVTYLQSVKKIQWKDYEELTSQSMHYHLLFTRCSCQKMTKLKNPVSLSKKYFFQHQTSSCISFNMSVTYLQSVEKIQKFEFQSAGVTLVQEIVCTQTFFYQNLSFKVPVWPWKWGQVHQNLITSFPIQMKYLC